MAPRKTSRDMGLVTLQPRPIGPSDWHGPLALVGDIELRAAATYQIDDPGMPYVAVITITAHKGRLACRHVELDQRPGGPPVTGTGLRSVPVDAYLTLIWRDLASKGGGGALLRKAEEFPGAVAMEPLSVEDIRIVETRRRQRHSMDETLPKVAYIYRQALASDDESKREAPTETVAKALRYSRGHASRLVAMARDQGLLGPASPGRGGEFFEDEGGSK